MSLALRNLLFTIVIPGSGGVYVPWLLLARRGQPPMPLAWYATGIIAAGVVLYFWCLWVFAVVGRGTPGVWDAPRRFVAVGPYRWVRNPIYVAALLIVLGEAWLFLSVVLVVYGALLAVAFHLLVVFYEEPRLNARFAQQYTAYRQQVARWIPRPPRNR